MKNSNKNHNKSQYYLSDAGCFEIENYNKAKPFSNFFPGIAGIWGIPMWVFFVNRGQCISSFGIEGKDKAMLEFQPANKAYRLTSSHGFRTFIKVKSGTKTFFWEPFQDPSRHPSFKLKHEMCIKSHDLTIEETNTTLGLVVRVNYFTMPKEDFPALVRRVTVENISKKKYAIEVIDGLPVITSFGIKDWLAKHLSRTVEAWIKVDNLKAQAPFFHLKVEVSDTPDVTHITEGNFYFSFTSSKQKSKLSEAIVDASCVFGKATDFSSPQAFLEAKKYQVPSLQQTSNRTPCAMSLTKFNLAPKRSQEIISLIGYAHNEGHLKKIVKEATAEGFIDKKAKQNEDVIARIKNCAFTNSSSPEFNLYSSQTFLDNVLRGGLPVTLKTGAGNTTFNVFSRKHGDLERDYNYFTLAPTHFSQGNGNYRDVNQNRRNDVWFNKNVRDNSIVNFLSLVQADGYNPLITKGMSFVCEDHAKIDEVVKRCIQKGDTHLIRQRLLSGFQPGELLILLSQHDIPLKVTLKEFLAQVLSICHKQELADPGEGFWVDHWTYNLDLIESYLAIYPEDLRSLLLERKDFSFYLNDHYVLPREERYVLTPKGVRQYHAVKSDAKEIHASLAGHKLRTQNGQGEVYFTTLIAKLLCLITTKAATWDPSGIGIDMEAGKPGWYDALNGLPGLLGSSLCETLELKRYCVFLLEQIEQLHLRDNHVFKVFAELSIFIHALKELLSTEGNSVSFWHKANDIKERYRSKILKGIDGDEEAIPIDSIRNFLKLIISKADHAVKKARDKKGLLPTYFFYEVTAHKKLTGRHVYPVEFKKHVLPLFLEGFVHALRVESNQDKARQLYQLLRKSPLFDKKLKMYKVNADLSDQTEEIGRTRIFPRGWLENESIWLHMEYKYLLELLRSRLFKEFYETFQEILIPFLDAERYGRSTLENSSFIVSSAHEDKGLHGQGFVARLSGSTAEFMHIWLLMNVGKRPFRLDHNGQLFCVFKPALAGWLFTKKANTVEYYNSRHQRQTVTLEKNTYAFNFMGSTLVVYHNPKRVNTYDKSKCRIKKIVLTYLHHQRPAEIKGETIPTVYAKDIRSNRVDRIDVYFE